MLRILSLLSTSATNGGGSPLAPVPNNLVRTNVGNHDDAMMRTDSDDSTTTPSTHDQQSDESSDYSMSSLVHDFKALSIHESQRKITHYFTVLPSASPKWMPS